MITPLVNVIDMSPVMYEPVTGRLDVFHHVICVRKPWREGSSKSRA